jgi:hypothetical protein
MAMTLVGATYMVESQPMINGKPWREIEFHADHDCAVQDANLRWGRGDGNVSITQPQAVSHATYQTTVHYCHHCRVQSEEVTNADAVASN